MRPLELIILLLSLILWIICVSFLFLTRVGFGFAGLIAMIISLILFFNAEYFIISRLEKFVHSPWIIFKIKLRWANGVSFLIMLILMVIVQLVFYEDLNK